MDTRRRTHVYKVLTQQLHDLAACAKQNLKAIRQIPAHLGDTFSVLRWVYGLIYRQEAMKSLCRFSLYLIKSSSRIVGLVTAIGTPEFELL